MIQQYLIPAIKEHFPDAGFSYNESSQPIASLMSPCVELGRLDIADDGDEITVYLGRATHGHFSCYAEELSQEEKERQIASDVIGFLEALLSDHVVAWMFLGGMAGGWRVLDSDETTPGPSVLKRQFLWSKEIV